MKKIISMISIMILIIYYISNVFATNIVDVNSIMGYEVNEIIDNTIDDVVDDNSITKEELEQAIKKLNKDTNEDFILEGDKITFSFEGKEYRMKYNLDGNPKFISRAVITKNMTMDEYNEETQNLILGIFGFTLVGINKGIETKDALLYAMFSLFDNIDFSKGEIVTEDTFNSIEIASKFFKEDIVIEEDLYKLNMKKVSNTESEYIVEAVYEVKTDEDFSILEDYEFEYRDNSLADLLDKVQSGRENYQQAEMNESIKLNEWLSELDKQNTIVSNIVEIPQTGKRLQDEDILWIILISSVSVFIVYCAYNKRKNGK